MKPVIIIVIAFVLFVPVSEVYAEHIFEDAEAFAQYLDIAQLSSEKFVITVDDDSYDMYYGYHGSLDSMASDKPQPKLSSMSINQERKSLEITFDEVPADSVFWVRMPFDVIFAENEHFQLLIDGQETLYDLTKFPNDYSLGMIVPKEGQHVEIIGTKVIPEFSIMVLPIFVISVLLIVTITRRYSMNLKF